MTTLKKAKIILRDLKTLMPNMKFKFQEIKIYFTKN